MVHVALAGFGPQRVDLLGHLDHVQRGHTHDLGLAALEQRAAVRPRDDGDLGRQGADVGDAATVDAEVIGQDALPDELLGQRPERRADLLLAAGVLLGQPVEHLDLDLVGALVALVLARDGQRFGQRVGGYRGDGVVHVLAVLGEQRVLGGLLAGLAGQLGLRVAQRRDERLGRLETLGHHGLGGRTGTAGDQFDHVVGGLGLDHHDRDVVGLLDLAAGDDHVEHGALELLDGRERNPLAVDEGDPYTAHRPGERQAGDLRRRRRGIDRQHVVEILGIQAQHRHDDLDLVAQPGDERGAQRTVDQAAGQDRVGGRPAFTPEERTGDAARGVHPLLDVDGQRKEVEVVLRALAGSGRAQQHGFVVEVGDDGAGGLLGQPPGLEADGAGAEAPVVDHGGRFEHAFINFYDRHKRPYGLSGVIIQLFCVGTREVPPPGQPGAAPAQMRRRPSIEAAGVLSGSHYRRPRDRAVPVVSRGNDPCGSARTAPGCSRLRQPNAPMVHPGTPQTPNPSGFRSRPPHTQ